jgi:tetratricopeptide (TPR) repeat protein
VAPAAPHAFPDAALWALIVCAALLAYWPALQGTLLWDDGSHVTRPALESLHGLWRIWFDLGATQQYYPLLHSAFWLEHRLWGDAVLGYHLLNVALHALSACLVVLIARRLSLAAAWLAGLLFALHPVAVEAVAWISEQKSTLSGVFCLSAALVYLHFDSTRRRQHYLLATALYVLALLSKTITATLPAALLVILWWQRGRIGRRDVVPLAPWFALGAAAGILTAWVERTYIGAEGSEFSLSLAQRALLAGRVPWFYAFKLVWPLGLTFTYPRWTLDPAVWWQYLFPAASVALLIVLVRLARRGRRGPLASVLIFAGILVPVLGFLNVYPFRFSFVADHFQYLACFGLIVPFASVLVSASNRSAAVKAAPVILLFILAGLTWRQSQNYKDAETLYRATLANNPESWMAHNNLGLILAQSSRQSEGIAEYEAALRLRPDYDEAHLNLGNALQSMPGRLQEAIAHYEAALRIDPNYAEAHNDLGGALSQLPGSLPDAIAHYEAALRLKPDYAEAHNNLGNALAQTPNRLPDAIRHYEAALRIRPDYEEAHNNLASALARISGRLQEAITHYQAALRLDPNDAEAHYNLGIALSQAPATQAAAISEFEAALRLRPDLESAKQMIERLKRN